MTSDELYSKSNTNFHQGKINNNDYINNNNNNYNKNNYETQYTNNKINFEKKKSNRRHTTKSIDFLCSHNNITGNENKIVDDITAKNSKKLFENVYYKKSLSNLYRGDFDKTQNLKPQPEKKEIIHALKTKKHFVIFIFFKFFITF
jgi:hypothetical protein